MLDSLSDPFGTPTPVVAMADGVIVGASLKGDGSTWNAVGPACVRAFTEAALEGIGYGFRHHLDIIAEHGPLTTRARCTNGGARAGLWK